jgi:hypothetical protein
VSSSLSSNDPSGASSTLATGPQPTSPHAWGSDDNNAANASNGNDSGNSGNSGHDDQQGQQGFI